MSADGRRIFTPRGGLDEGDTAVYDAANGKEISRFDPKGKGVLVANSAIRTPTGCGSLSPRRITIGTG